MYNQYNMMNTAGILFLLLFNFIVNKFYYLHCVMVILMIIINIKCNLLPYLRTIYYFIHSYSIISSVIVLTLSNSDS